MAENADSVFLSINRLLFNHIFPILIRRRNCEWRKSKACTQNLNSENDNLTFELTLSCCQKN